jgi:hypothetical protein
MIPRSHVLQGRRGTPRNFSSKGPPSHNFGVVAFLPDLPWKRQRGMALTCPHEAILVNHLFTSSVFARGASRGRLFDLEMDCHVDSFSCDGYRRVIFSRIVTALGTQRVAVQETQKSHRDHIAANHKRTHTSRFLRPKIKNA